MGIRKIVQLSLFSVYNVESNFYAQSTSLSIIQTEQRNGYVEGIKCRYFISLMLRDVEFIHVISIIFLIREEGLYRDS